MSIRAVQENIKKARRSFFMFGNIDVFQGDLSPLSSQSVAEVCVLNETTTGLLESFLAEMGKRILKVGIEQCNECGDRLAYYEGEAPGKETGFLAVVGVCCWRYAGC